MTISFEESLEQDGKTVFMHVSETAESTPVLLAEVVEVTQRIFEGEMYVTFKVIKAAVK